MRALSRFVESYGFTLAVPFDNIRSLGYIGRYDEKGGERIIDDGSCFEKLKSVKPRKPSKIVLGEFSKQTKFSLKSFLNVFASIFGIDAGLEYAKNITLKFPKKFLQSNYFTEVEIEEALPKLTPTCRSKVTDPRNFLITQTLETDAIEYAVELKKKIDAKAQTDLTKAMEAQAKSLKIGAEIHWQSEKEFSIIVFDPETRLTVAYKAMRLAAKPFKP